MYVSFIHVHVFSSGFEADALDDDIVAYIVITILFYSVRSFM